MQLSGQKEDGLLSDVSPRTQFSLSVLFQSYVPVFILVLLGQICVVVVLLQLLQEVTFISDCGLREKHTKQAPTADGTLEV